MSDKAYFIQHGEEQPSVRETIAQNSDMTAVAHRISASRDATMPVVSTMAEYHAARGLPVSDDA